MSRIRAMLYVCSWSAKRCNNACKELYDRLIEKGKAKKVALAYEEQILEKIETDYHDIKVDFIINTEKIIKTY